MNRYCGIWIADLSTNIAVSGTPFKILL